MIDAEAFLRGRSMVIAPQHSDDAASTTSSASLMRDGGIGHANSAAQRSAGAGEKPDSVRRPNVGTALCGPDDIADDKEACRESALRLLDAAPRSSSALRDRLLGKGYAEDTVAQVVERLIAVRLLDDEEYAESVVRICAGRMMGRRGTLMELSRKGVDRVLAQQVTDEADQQGVFEDAAWELGRRVARKTQGLDRQVRQRRFWSAGGRKGHNPETLRRVASELLR
ncbi:regulatory protein RecX [Bifidobacterium olomucense]|uniref:regulatory protein RecX n=1 Tax=Bifidobacterium olomucense TaxID=2675324 RepID=UPI00145EDA64|nr:regulatory protein RecX [Bifidobacterium sp. DSM 109959]